jgi:glycosyltransferase involved in cell wall biosynthesis
MAVGLRWSSVPDSPDSALMPGSTRCGIRGRFGFRARIRAPSPFREEVNRVRWLEWTPNDPHSLIGGIETHVLSMAHCLRERGVDVHFSSDPQDLFSGTDFDVIRTHGDMLPKGYLHQVKKGPLRVHTLHGSALGQMRGLNESFRARHWKAFYREWSGCARADMIAGVHEDLELMRYYSASPGRTLVLRNGWDALIHLPTKWKSQNDWTDAWAYIGRGWDPVKGGDRVLRALHQDESFKLIAVPGEGLPEHFRVLKTGRLNASEVRQVLSHCRGLILPSRFEGLSLVLLEALAAGAPVVASKVGGNASVESCVPRGLTWFTDPDNPSAFLADLQTATEKFPAHLREERARWNQERLWSWGHSTDLLLMRVREILANK